MSDSLYHDNLLLHYHRPKNYGLFSDFDIETRGNNPLCGDSLTIRLKFNGEVVADVSFEGEGCVISRAAASLVSEHVKGKSCEEVRAMTSQDVMTLLGVTVMPARMKCAMLALETIQKTV